MRKAAFLQDESSQILALRDALASAHGTAVSAAFDDVARSRGLAQIAADAGLRADQLCRALANPARPDMAVLVEVVEALLRAHPRLRDAGRADVGAE